MLMRLFKIGRHLGEKNVKKEGVKWERHGILIWI